MQGVKRKSLLIEIIVDALTEKFGDFPTRAILSHLEKNYALKKDEIPKKPDIFLKILKEMFGAYGGKALESVIVKEVHEKLGIGMEISSFIDCAKRLKKQ